MFSNWHYYRPYVSLTNADLFTHSQKSALNAWKMSRFSQNFIMGIIDAKPLLYLCVEPFWLASILVIISLENTFIVNISKLLSFKIFKGKAIDQTDVDFQPLKVLCSRHQKHREPNQVLYPLPIQRQCRLIKWINCKWINQQGYNKHRYHILLGSSIL